MSARSSTSVPTMPAVKVVQANKAYWPHLGGIETVARDLAEGVRDRGWESVVVVAAEGTRTEHDIVDGVRVERAGTWLSRRSIRVSPDYPQLLLRERADVLHVHVPAVLPELTLAALTDAAVRRRFGRLIVSWHSDVVRQRQAAKLYRPVVQRLLDRADHVIVATPHHVTSSAWLSEYQGKVAVVPFGVNVDSLHLREGETGQVDALRERYGPFALFLGRLVYYKGVPELLAAAAGLAAGRVVMVGEGPLEPEVRSSPAFLGGRVTLLAPVSDTEKRLLLNAADVLVLPSVANSEAYGIVQVEAMACGTPVVTFDLPTGVTWVNRPGDTGLVVPLGDINGLAAALDLLLTDETLRARLGSSAQDRVVRELTLDAQRAATFALYEC